MALIKCKMCGGDLLLVAGQSVAECEYCGSRQTVPAADNEKKLTLFARANRLRAACEFDKAAGIYESIVADFPEEAEAYWGLVLCKYGIEYVDDPATGKKIPTCHRSSFDSILEDGNFEQAMENADLVAQKVYREEAKQFERIRKDIISVSANEEPYDIFICYKENDEHGRRSLDSVLAHDLYLALTDKGYRVFFSRITLKGKLGQEYEPYIFAALNSAKIMLAVGTCYEHYNSVWVKNEWSRFLKICEADRSKHLIPCFKNMDMQEDAPKEFKPLEFVDLGQMGATQDILWNMEKYIPLKKQTVVQENIIVNTEASNKVASLLHRGNMALEDGEWRKADQFFEEVLNQDSKNFGAYIGKALMAEKCATLEKLAQKRLSLTETAQPKVLTLPPDDAHIREIAAKCDVPGFLGPDDVKKLYRFNLSYNSSVESRQAQRQEEESYWKNNRMLTRAVDFGGAEAVNGAKQRVLGSMDARITRAQAQQDAEQEDLQKRYRAHLILADKQAQTMLDKATQDREKLYQENKRIVEESWDLSALNKARSMLTGVQTPALLYYKDSEALLNQCTAKIKDLQAQQSAREAAERAVREERAREAAQAQRARDEALRKEQKKKDARQGIITLIVIVALVAGLVYGGILLFTKIIPGNRYEKAAELMAAGNYLEAAEKFDKLGNFQDAAAQAEACRDRVYSQAEALVAQKKYLEAADVFAQLGNYRDAAQRVQVCQDAHHAKQISDIEAMAADGRIAEAAMAFAALGEKERSMALWDKIAQRKMISADIFRVIAIRKDGTVLNTRIAPQDWTDIVDVVALEDTIIGLRSDGSTVCAGVDDYYGNVQNVVQISGKVGLAAYLHYDGTVTVAGTGLSKEEIAEVEAWTGIVAVAAGARHLVGLKADGTVVATGYNEYHQCDVGQWKDIVSIFAGTLETIGLKADGTVVYLGNKAEDYGFISDWTDIVAIASSGQHIVGLKADGTLLARGNNTYGECEVTHLTGVVAIAVTDNDTIAVLSDGTVFQVGCTLYDAKDWTDIRIPNITGEEN